MPRNRANPSRKARGNRPKGQVKKFGKMQQESIGSKQGSTAAP